MSTIIGSLFGWGRIKVHCAELQSLVDFYSKTAPVVLQQNVSIFFKTNIILWSRSRSFATNDKMTYVIRVCIQNPGYTYEPVALAQCQEGKRSYRHQRMGPTKATTRSCLLLLLTKSSNRKVRRGRKILWLVSLLICLTKN